MPFLFLVINLIYCGVVGYCGVFFFLYIARKVVPVGLFKECFGGWLSVGLTESGDYGCVVTGNEGFMCYVYFVICTGVSKNYVWCGGYVTCYISRKMGTNVPDHAVLYKLMYLLSLLIDVSVSKCVMIDIEVCYRVNRYVPSKNVTEVWYGNVLACRWLI